MKKSQILKGICIAVLIILLQQVEMRKNQNHGWAKEKKVKREAVWIRSMIASLIMRTLHRKNDMVSRLLIWISRKAIIKIAFYGLVTLLYIPKRD